MEITTRTAVIPIEAIQAAYNDAVMSGRMALAWEITRIWTSTLTEQEGSASPDNSRHRIVEKGG